jgi:hypothetical protein
MREQFSSRLRYSGREAGCGRRRAPFRGRNSSERGNQRILESRFLRFAIGGEAKVLVDGFAEGATEREYQVGEAEQGGVRFFQIVIGQKRQIGKLDQLGEGTVLLAVGLRRQNGPEAVPPRARPAPDRAAGSPRPVPLALH